MQTLHFLSGLPRTGSTVLACLLNQHPDVYASPTSPLVDLLQGLDSKITELRRRYSGFSREQELNLHRAMLERFYQHIPRRFVFDKHRGWPGTIPALSMFIAQPKIICTVRPIAEVITSVLVLLAHAGASDNFLDQGLRARGLPVGTTNRAMLLWQEYIAPLHRTISLAKKRYPDVIGIVRYHDLVTTPLATLAKIESFAGLPPCSSYDLNNISNGTPEDDQELWGIPGLHQVRAQLRGLSRDPEEVLGRELTQHFRQLDHHDW